MEVETLEVLYALGTQRKVSFAFTSECWCIRSNDLNLFFSLLNQEMLTKHGNSERKVAFLPILNKWKWYRLIKCSWLLWTLYEFSHINFSKAERISSLAGIHFLIKIKAFIRMDEGVKSDQYTFEDPSPLLYSMNLHSLKCGMALYFTASITWIYQRSLWQHLGSPRQIRVWA